MRHRIIEAFALVLAALAIPTAAEALSTTVNCPGESIADALSAGFDEITVEGTCTENVEIRQDDVTIQGNGNDTVMGELFVNGARRVTIQNLSVQGDGTPGTNGIVATNDAAVTVAGAVVDGPGDHGVIALHGASAVLDQVTIRNATHGVAAEDNASVEIRNGSLIENMSEIGIRIGRGSSGVVLASTIENNGGTGIDFDLGAGGNVIGSTIQSNGGTGIHVFRGAAVVLDGNTIQGSPEGVSVNTHATAWLGGNTISNSSADEGALFIGWGSSVRMIGGNTITSDGSAVFLRQGATLNQRNGDVVNGSVTIDALSNAEFRSVSIAGKVDVVDHSLVRFQDQSGDPANVSVKGDISISRDSGLNFVGDFPVRVVGNIGCADPESSLGKGTLSLKGKIKPGCTGY
jgi:parallel beta-helix repeat protein